MIQPVHTKEVNFLGRNNRKVYRDDGNRLGFNFKIRISTNKKQNYIPVEDNVIKVDFGAKQ